MGKKYEERVEELKAQKKPDEKIECIVNIDGRPKLILYIAIALASFAIGRILAGKFAVLMITNIISMVMMVDAARVIIDTQEACLIITNRRIYGKAGKDMDLRFRDIQSVQNTANGIFIKLGVPHRSVMLRNVRNKEEVLQTLSRHV